MDLGELYARVSELLYKQWTVLFVFSSAGWLAYGKVERGSLSVAFHDFDMFVARPCRRAGTLGLGLRGKISSNWRFANGDSKETKIFFQCWTGLEDIATTE